MCGIAGVAIPRTSRRAVDPRLVERMRDTMTHRGPDGAGLFIGDRVGLGHRRLSIVDLAGGAQPMASDDGLLQITYNGEVYNHASLRVDLEARGHVYRTRSDTETVLRMYQQVGGEAPRQLRGMFAFGIWDGCRHELFLCRDRLGVKPLYYALANDGTIFFASEIKALVTTGAVGPAFNPDVLPDLLANYAPSGPNTLFAGIRSLPPGHTLLWRDGAVRIEPYWDLRYATPVGGQAVSEADAVAEFGERFREAVRLRLMADVPLGAFLSGGIDSAAVTATMSALTGGPVSTFSVGFSEQEANELAYARLVARTFRTRHHEIVLSASDFFDSLPRMIWHEDEPIAHPSSIPLHFVSRLAAEHVKVVLTGEGSDEALAGYLRYRNSLINLAAGKALSTPPGRILRAGLRRAIDALPRASRPRRRLVRTALYLDDDFDTLYFDNFAVFSRGRQRRLLSAGMRERVGRIDPYAAAHRHLETMEGADMLNSLLYLDVKTYLVELLMKQDQMSMSASIESRVPFLDHPLLEFVASLPTSLKLRGATTKYILRRSMRGTLPAEILERPKMGFPVPLDRWFRGAFAPVVEEYLVSPRTAARGLFDPDAVQRLLGEHHAGLENHGQRLWMLMNIELWHRIFIDGELPARTPVSSRLESDLEVAV